MVRGFTGQSATRFITATNNSLLTAIQEHSRNPFENVSSEGHPLPRLNRVVNQRLPFQTEGMPITWHRIGIGNSTNMVVNEAVYDDVLRRTSMLDDQVGEELYKCAEAIEKMCGEIFIVPETAARILAITSEIKQSMGHFRYLTEEVITLARRYTNEMIRIDMGN